MRKFVFSLEPVNRYKLTVEKLQRAELKTAQEALKLLLLEDEALVNAFERARDELLGILADGAPDVNEFLAYDRFFAGVRDARERLEPRIRRAEDEVTACMTRLITTMKELKVYKKLRDAQYQTYRKEAEAEDEKSIGDLLSFNVISDSA
ncbi:MAG: flagellar FliJ family protein [Oscillospiraceae bacterium]|jgi:flagellar export protein FliJ|nr:flagellar FliJ family protein [Oscillospiraceae bacterium]